MTTLNAFAKAVGTLSALFFLSACGGHADHSIKSGAQVQVGDLMVSGSWIRAAEPPAKTSAIYLTVSNAGDQSDALVSVSTEIAEFSEVHQSLTKADVALMRTVKELEIRAGESVSFEPGSYHIMLINLTGRIEKDQTYPVTLTFRDAGEVTVEPVARQANAGGHDHH